MQENIPLGFVLPRLPIVTNASAGVCMCVCMCVSVCGGGLVPEMNMFEQVFSDGYQMSLAGGTGSGARDCRRPGTVTSRAPWVMVTWRPPLVNRQRRVNLPVTSLSGGNCVKSCFIL